MVEGVIYSGEVKRKYYNYSYNPLKDGIIGSEYGGVAGWCFKSGWYIKKGVTGAVYPSTSGQCWFVRQSSHTITKYSIRALRNYSSPSWWQYCWSVSFTDCCVGKSVIYECLAYIRFFQRIRHSIAYYTYEGTELLHSNVRMGYQNNRPISADNKMYFLYRTLRVTHISPDHRRGDIMKTSGHHKVENLTHGQFRCL